MADGTWTLQGGIRRRGSDTQGLLERNGSSYSALSVEIAVLQDSSSEVQRKPAVHLMPCLCLQHPAAASHMIGRLLTAVASLHLLMSMHVGCTVAAQEYLRTRRHEFTGTRRG